MSFKDINTENFQTYEVEKDSILRSKHERKNCVIQFSLMVLVVYKQMFAICSQCLLCLH